MENFIILLWLQLLCTKTKILQISLFLPSRIKSTPWERSGHLLDVCLLKFVGPGSFWRNLGLILGNIGKELRDRHFWIWDLLFSAKTWSCSMGDRYWKSGVLTLVKYSTSSENFTVFLTFVLINGLKRPTCFDLPVLERKAVK